LSEIPNLISPPFVPMFSLQKSALTPHPPIKSEGANDRVFILEPYRN